ncbi:hypothetical protein BKA93DRAFT_754333 [Sparassis latifolia]
MGMGTGTPWDTRGYTLALHYATGCDRHRKFQWSQHEAGREGGGINGSQRKIKSVRTVERRTAGVTGSRELTASVRDERVGPSNARRSCLQENEVTACSLLPLGETVLKGSAGRMWDGPAQVRRRVLGVNALLDVASAAFVASAWACVRGMREKARTAGRGWNCWRAAMAAATTMRWQHHSVGGGSRRVRRTRALLPWAPTESA